MKDPHIRAKELGGTGIPHPFSVDYSALVDNPENVEKSAHRKLRACRDQKEWFRCSVEFAVDAIQMSAQNHIHHEELKSIQVQQLEIERNKRLKKQQDIAVKREEKIKEQEQARLIKQHHDIQVAKEKKAQEIAAQHENENRAQKSRIRSMKSVNRYLKIFTYLLSALGIFLIFWNINNYQSITLIEVLFSLFGALVLFITLYPIARIISDVVLYLAGRYDASMQFISHPKDSIKGILGLLAFFTIAGILASIFE